MPDTNPNNSSLPDSDNELSPGQQKLQSARQVAVQYLYSKIINDEMLDLEDYLAELKKKFANNRNVATRDLGLKISPDFKLLRSVLSYHETSREHIQSKIISSLNDKLSWEKLGAMNKAILQAFVSELMMQKGKVSYQIIISEYVNVALVFAQEREQPLLNGIMKSIAEAG